MPQPVPTATGAAQYTGPLADATLTITIPAPSNTTSSTRKPAYVSAATTQIVFTSNAQPSNLTTAQYAAVTAQLGSKPVTLGSAACPVSGAGWTCTFKFVLPPASYDMTISAQDGTNTVLSQERSTLAVVAGSANLLTITFDAQPSTITISTVGGSYYAGSIGTIANPLTVAILRPLAGAGSNSQAFTVTLKDSHGNTIIPPGMPVMSVTTSGNTDIAVANVVQGNGSTTPYSFTLNASRTNGTVTSVTPTTITVSFTGTNAPTDGITSKSQTFKAVNAQLIALGGQTSGAVSGIELFAYGDGQFIQYGSFIADSTALSGHLANQLAFDNAQDLFVADYTASNAGAVVKIPFSQLKQASPAGTVYTAATKKLEPFQIVDMDVAGDGTVAIAQNPNNYWDPTIEPDALIVAPAGSTSFSLGWNNIGALVSSGCQCQGGAESATVITDSSQNATGGYALGLLSGTTGPGSGTGSGYAAFVYTSLNSTIGASVGCDTPSGTTPCYEADSTSNVNSQFAQYVRWDYANQKFVYANDPTNATTYQVLDFSSVSPGVVSTSSTVIDTVNTTSAGGFPERLAASPHGFVAGAYQGPTTGHQVSVYNNAGTPSKILNAYGGVPTIYTTGFISDATTDALVIIGTNARGGAGSSVVNVYSIAATPSLLASLTPSGFTIGRGAVGTQSRYRMPGALRRGQRSSLYPF